MHLALATIAIATTALLAATEVDLAFAQGAPFGAPRPQTPAPPMGGIVGWIFAKQTEFDLAMRAFLRQARTDGSAVWGMLGMSFLYGIFHAAGPGHGKAVISSYVIANRETWVRGVALSFASAFLQALAAVVFVAVAAMLLNATQRMMCNAERVIEIASYALIALIGMRLLWVKGSGFVASFRSLHRPASALGAAVTPAGELHEHHDHHHHAPTHDHDHDHDHASSCGHGHGPQPQELAGPGGWTRGLAAVVAVGARPCSGAIIVLVFALSQGLFWVGVAATFTMALGTAVTVATIATLAVTARSFASGVAAKGRGYGELVMRGIEVAASVLIIAFGVLLLAGYMFTDRLPLC